MIGETGSGNGGTLQTHRIEELVLPIFLLGEVVGDHGVSSIQREVPLIELFWENVTLHQLRAPVLPPLPDCQGPWLKQRFAVSPLQ